jgi:hypothetical protein
MDFLEILNVSAVFLIFPLLLISKATKVIVVFVILIASFLQMSIFLNAHLLLKSETLSILSLGLLAHLLLMSLTLLIAFLSDVSELLQVSLFLLVQLIVFLTNFFTMSKTISGL